MNDLIERLRLGDGTSPDHELLLEAADALEALAQPEQEFVAWEQFYPDIGKPQLTYPPQGIYYTPPQRTWVGLTLDDIPDDDTNNLDFYRGGRWAERVLKEKNNG